MFKRELAATYSESLYVDLFYHYTNTSIREDHKYLCVEQNQIFAVSTRVKSEFARILQSRTQPTRLALFICPCPTMVVHNRSRLPSSSSHRDQGKGGPRANPPCRTPPSATTMVVAWNCGMDLLRWPWYKLVCGVSTSLRYTQNYYFTCVTHQIYFSVRHLVLTTRQHPQINTRRVVVSSL